MLGWIYIIVDCFWWEGSDPDIVQSGAGFYRIITVVPGVDQANRWLCLSRTRCMGDWRVGMFGRCGARSD